MNFVVLLAHFVGWVVTIPILIYLIVSLSITLYAFFFWYSCWYMDLRRLSFHQKARFSYRVGFRNFWDWFLIFVAYLTLKILGSKNLSNKKFPPFSKEWS
jgi:hypothetical protein